MNVEEDKLIVSALIADDPEVIKEFFFHRCRGALTYIGEYFSNVKERPESFIGEFYAYLKQNDWHRLRIFKHTCSLNSYVSLIATRYFQSKRKDRERLIGDVTVKGTEDAVDAVDSFAEQDVTRIVSTMNPLDRFLIQRILFDGEKPGNVMEEVKPFMRAEHIASMNNKQFAGYVYTRYSKVKRKLQDQLKALGYGA